MKNLLLTIYIILGVIITLSLFESGMSTAENKLATFFYAGVFGLLTLLMLRRLGRKLRIF